jgi:hypothetical protein
MDSGQVIARSSKPLSAYENCHFELVTSHAKGRAVAPAFLATLGAVVSELQLDTDTLGTFSGETEREGSALDCARRKCLWGIEESGAEFCLASEGSFGPHPYIPFLPSDREILYIIDRRHDFELYESRMTHETNYRTATVSSFARLDEFARQVKFPAHALIVRPNLWRDKSVLFKGITSMDSLQDAFIESCHRSEDGLAWVETDMRAHLNPERMAVIAELAAQMAQRLATPCPACNTPGFGRLRVEKGLLCGDCGTATELVKIEVYGCARCDHTEARPRSDGLTAAEPGNCPYCNP